MGTKILVATNNQHKIDEFKAIFEGSGYEFVTLAEAGIVSDPEETGGTFEENARIKAQAAFEACGGSMPVVADDSGLEVDYLGGRPGVLSSRFAGDDATDEQNNQKLLDELKGIPDLVRVASFKTVLVYIDETGSETVVKGYCGGAIGHTPRGENGFGYDPLFWPSDRPEKTMAELSSAEKNQISHRGMALKKLREMLRIDAPDMNLL